MRDEEENLLLDGCSDRMLSGPDEEILDEPHRSVESWAERENRCTCPLNTFGEQTNVHFLTHENPSIAETDALAEAFDTLSDGVVLGEFDVFTMNQMKL